MYTCTKCNGLGKLHNKECSICKGKGTIGYVPKMAIKYSKSTSNGIITQDGTPDSFNRRGRSRLSKSKK